MSIYDFQAVSIEGHEVLLAEFRGQVLLVVNVASRCGYTPQYRGLEQLFRAHHARGFTVLGFPCDQFGRQEPGTEADIRAFCTQEYDVTFPMFAKISVNGPNAHPLYRWLTTQKKGLFGLARIKWNFTKFLVGRDGRVIERYGSLDTPHAIEPAIEQALG